MKIIKEGKKVIETMEVTCKTCEAVLEVEASDLTSFWDGWTFICPYCGREGRILKGTIPEGLAFALKRK